MYPPVPSLEDLIYRRDKPSRRPKKLGPGEAEQKDENGNPIEAKDENGNPIVRAEAKEGDDAAGQKKPQGKKGAAATLASSLCCFGKSEDDKKGGDAKKSGAQNGGAKSGAGSGQSGSEEKGDAKDGKAKGKGGFFGCCGSKGEQEEGKDKDGEKKEGSDDAAAAAAKGDGKEGEQGDGEKKDDDDGPATWKDKFLGGCCCRKGKKKKEEEEKPLTPEEEKRLEMLKPVPTLRDLVLRRRKPTLRPYQKPRDKRPFKERAKELAKKALTPRPELIRTVVIGPGMWNYCDNYLSTAKYTALTFFPKCLFEQLRRIGNLYFVVISALMIVGTYTDYFNSPLKPFSVLLPLLVVLAVSMIQEGIADSRRHNGDEDVNSQLAVTANGPHEFMCWQDIRVGNMLVVKNGEPLPADIAVIASSEEEGLCFVETSQLDGESNLKRHRAVLWSSSGKPDLNEIKEACKLFEGVIECEGPNLNLNSFNGRLLLEDKEPMPLDQENFLVRGSTLMNTKWVVGVACYTGKETKIAKNGRRPASKLTRIDRAINMAALTILATDLFLVTVSAGLLWYFEQDSLDKLPYLGYFVDGTDPQYKDFYNGMEWGSADTIYWQGWLTFLILYNNFVPISMYVSIEIITFFMIFFLNNDEEMFHEKSNTRAKARSSNITDLGQIHYVFTDKTGTLTENEMRFKRASVAGIVYGRPVDAEAVARTRLLAAGHNPIYAAAIAAAAELEARRKKKEERRAAKDKGKKKSRRAQRRANKKERRKWHQQPAHIVSIDNRAIGERRRKRLAQMNAASTAAARAAAEGFTLPVVDDYQEMQSLANAAAAPEDWSEAAVCARVFLEVLAAANTVMVEDTPKGVVYQAESPDERALVEAAASMGHTLVSRSRRNVTVAVHGETRTYEVLAINAFDSDRKRMSILVRGADGVVTLLCKGADNVMMGLARDPHAPTMEPLRQHLEEFAAEGLRTLVLAVRTLTDAEYEEWELRRRMADEDEKDRDKMLQDVAIDVEKNLDILGATAIEDRLQEGVPDTMAALAAAGIKTWVLTGDKRETAINIGYASKVLEPEMRLYILRDSDRRTVLMSLSQMYKKLAHVPVRNPSRFVRWFRPNRCRVLRILLAAQKVMEEYCQYEYRDPQEDAQGPIDKTSDKPAFVVEGTALTHILGKPGLEAMVLGVASKCQAVIACRVSPKQKSVLVKMVQKYVFPKPVTLAIGDGANDVPMLRQAQVGVGISGMEGRQAVNSADFSIAQFRFLKRLLLVHGRWNYRRLCKVVLYSFLKNLVLIVTLFCYSFYTGFSGTPLYNDAFFAMFNFFLGLPIVGVGLFDRDISADYALKHPQVYAPGRDNTDLNPNVVLKYIVYGVLCGGMLFCAPVYLFASTGPMDMWGLATFGTVVATCLIIAMTLKVLMEHRSITYCGRGGCVTFDFKPEAPEYWTFCSSFGWSVFFLGFSLFFYFFTTIAYSSELSFDWQWYWSGLAALDSPILWLLAVLVPVSLILVDVAWNYTSNYLFPGPMNISAEQDYAENQLVKVDAAKPKKEAQKKKREEKAGQREEKMKAILRQRRAKKELRRRRLMAAAVAKGMLSPSALENLPPLTEDGYPVPLPGDIEGGLTGEGSDDPNGADTALNSPANAASEAGNDETISPLHMQSTPTPAMTSSSLLNNLGATMVLSRGLSPPTTSHSGSAGGSRASGAGAATSASSSSPAVVVSQQPSGYGQTNARSTRAAAGGGGGGGGAGGSPFRQQAEQKETEDVFDDSESGDSDDSSEGSGSDYDDLEEEEEGSESDEGEKEKGDALV